MAARRPGAFDGVRKVSRSAAVGPEAGRSAAYSVDGGAVPPLVAALMILGAVLRLYGIGAQSLWIDEMLTLRAGNIGGQLGLREALSNIQGPLHTVLIHWLARISASEWLLRLPSALAGILLIPVIYHLARELSGRRAGLFAAAITTVSPFSIWYSQEVRNYAFVMLFSAASSLLAWRILTGVRRRWILYVLSSAAAIYSNLSGIFVVAGHSLFAALDPGVRGRTLLRWALAVCLVAVLFAPFGIVGVMGWVSVDEVAERVTLAPAAAEEELVRGSTTFTPMAVPYSVFAMTYGYSLGPSTRELHVLDPLEAYAPHLWLVVPAGVVAAVVLVAGLLSLCRERRRVLFSVCLALTPLAGAAILGLFNVKPYNVRYVAVVFPVLMAIMGAGVARLGRRGVLLWGVVVLFCLVSVWGYYFDPRHAREDIRGVARYVEANERPGDVVLVPVVPHLFSFYFEGESDRHVLYKGQVRTAEDIAENVRKATAGHERLWFVDSRLWFIDEKRLIPAHLGESFDLLDRREFAGAVVSLYDIESVPGEGTEKSARFGPHR